MSSASTTAISCLESIIKSQLISPLPTAELNASLVVDSKNSLGECILYDEKTNKILWTDIYGRTFHTLSLDCHRVTSHNVPKQLCSFALTSGLNEGVYLCAWEDGFQLYDIIKGTAVSEMSAGIPVTPLGPPTRLNDGRCDRTGKRFICGGFYGDVKGNHMKAFRCECSPTPKKNSDVPHLVHFELDTIDIPDLEVTNSICFSPNGNTMYFADSPKREIYAYNYHEASGRCTAKRSLWQAQIGVPDGSCIDSEGFIWNAAWRSGYGPGKVHRINPVTGQVVFTVNLPDNTSQASCCCFGGKNLDVLFISTAAVDRDIDKEPNSGGVYACKLPFTGLQESRFQVPPKEIVLNES